MKKRIFCIIMAACILLTAAGCQSSGSESSIADTPSQSVSNESTGVETSSEVSSQDSENHSEEPENTVQQIKVSDMFTAPGRRIWLSVYHGFNTGTPISYDDPVYAVYVVENGKVMGYNGAQLSLEDFDQMTDDEIIAFAEEEFPNKDICEILFTYAPDATGNSLETEIMEVDTEKGIDTSPYPSLEFRDAIRGFFEPTTILSNQYFGIEFQYNHEDLLVTKYDSESPIEIILNEAGDEGIERK